VPYAIVFAKISFARCIIFAIRTHYGY